METKHPKLSKDIKLKKIELRKAIKQLHENWIKNWKKDDIAKLGVKVGGYVMVPIFCKIYEVSVRKKKRKIERKILEKSEKTIENFEKISLSSL